MSILSSINSPEDVKKLKPEQLSDLAFEIRQQIIDVTSQKGGHVSPNLGIVELSIALHRVFDTPKDQILFDVSHQCYTHKLLTGRNNEKFRNLRQTGGISGFCNRFESPHDALSKEALRLINKMPKWSPAKWEGKDVASLHHIFLRFHPFKPTYVVSEKSRFEGKETPHNMADPTLTRLPIFSEGNPQLWIARHVHYPATAITQGLTGRVYVSFVIDTDGSVCDVAIQKGVHPALDMAAYRAVCSMPKWFPGMADGKIVRVRHTLPINFQFSREKSIGPKTSAPRFPHQSFPHNR